MRKSKNHYFYHIFVSPGDAPGAIMLSVVWMEREFNAYKVSRSMYPSIFNNFPVIRTASAKNRHFHVPPPTFLFPLETNSMLTNCLAACAHLTITISEIQRDICEKIVILHTPLHSMPPLGGFPSEYRHPHWDGKARMVSLPDGEKISKICLFVLTWSTNVTDRQTDTAWQQRPRLHRIVR